MVLIIGGTYQGKTEFARRLAEERGAEPAGRRLTVADGRVDGCEKAYESVLISHFHAYIRRIQEQDLDITAEVFIDQIGNRNPDALILMDEVGYGIVPVKQEDRRYREMVGRAGQLLAKRAEAVYRVVCGIGTKIK